MTIALVFAVLMNGTAYFFSDKIALASSGAQPISREAVAAPLRGDGAARRQSEYARCRSST